MSSSPLTHVPECALGAKQTYLLPVDQQRRHVEFADASSFLSGIPITSLAEPDEKPATSVLINGDTTVTPPLPPALVTPLSPLTVASLCFYLGVADGGTTLNGANAKFHLVLCFPVSPPTGRHNAGYVRKLIGVVNANVVAPNSGSPALELAKIGLLDDAAANSVNFFEAGFANLLTLDSNLALAPGLQVSGGGTDGAAWVSFVTEGATRLEVYPNLLTADATARSAHAAAVFMRQH